MASIYKLGIRGLVWLGEETTACSEALTLIEDYSQRSKKTEASECSEHNPTDRERAAIYALFATRELWWRI